MYRSLDLSLWSSDLTGHQWRLYDISVSVEYVTANDVGLGRSSDLSFYCDPKCNTICPEAVNEDASPFVVFKRLFTSRNTTFGEKAEACILWNVSNKSKSNFRRYDCCNWQFNLVCIPFSVHEMILAPHEWPWMCLSLIHHRLIYVKSGPLSNVRTR